MGKTPVGSVPLVTSVALMLVKFAPLEAGSVAGNRPSGTVPEVKLLALKAVKSTVVKERVPDPSVFKTCPAVPSLVG